MPLFAPEFPTQPTRRRPIRRTLIGSTALAATASAAILAAATGAGATETVWDRVAECESGGNWSINTGNGYYGGLQFSFNTWKGFGGQRYAYTANLATKSQQILIAQEVLKVQGPGAWPTCSVRAGLTLENGLAVDVSRDSTRSLFPLAVDGQLGPRTRMGVETWVGGTVNGSWSSTDIKKLQHKVGTTEDGSLGPITRKAVQKRVGVEQDGSWGPITRRAIQRYLNGLFD
ncbi:transglycosylase-like protein with SLT domain [Knoellia remsis]|uniref:Transglycosylase-like protein with SLT domain n=1 Tax=Knoellia remsis TaxID=407159 RepID=A0A2T0UJE9_9MICO|nr:transglycosylase family protein [Knoellia remsis]PRY57996.1 transglycosylase-like protein with SLT domain [Knoellia remsis]